MAATKLLKSWQKGDKAYYLSSSMNLKVVNLKDDSFKIYAPNTCVWLENVPAQL